jgi:hypothetical protein
VAAGSYSLTARATSNAGATTTSSPVSVTVNSAPVSQPVSGPAAVGRWGAPFTWGLNGGVNPLHMTVLPNKRVLAWPMSKAQSQPQLWNPGAGTGTASFTLVPVPASVYRQDDDDIFCSGFVTLPNGRLLLAGGQESVNGKGIPNTFLFDFATNGWTRSADMGDPASGRDGRRWYPTTITLPSGAVLAVSGTTDGNIWDPANLAVNNRPEVYTNGSWSQLNEPPDGEGYDAYYPWLHVAPPDGGQARVFYSGPNPNTRSLNPATGELTAVGRTQWGQPRHWGTSVLYEPGKVLIVGGTPNYFYSDGWDLPTATAEVIDLNQPAPQWRYTRQGGAANPEGAQTVMASGRKHHNATLLPDGQVLILGGTNTSEWNSVDEWGGGNMCVPELWDPVSEVFTPMAEWTARVDGHPQAQLRTRAYHSTAVLLPDARVVVAGGEWASREAPNGEAPLEETAHEDAQVFSPPYLFNADGTLASRPTISAPAERSSFGYNAVIPITTGADQAPGIAEVNLVGLSAVTHAFNASQRFVRLRFTGSRTSNTLSVLAPASRHECPPGYYLLFVLQRNPLNNDRLVPSAARIIRIQ